MPELGIGPVYFHWDAEYKRDFYYRVADEADVDTVYLGEVICAKRASFFDLHLPAVVDRLEAAGKRVVVSTLAEVMTRKERALVSSLAGAEELLVEANDGTALQLLRGKPHRVGPFVNVYNEESMAMLGARGATHFSANPELPRSSLIRLAQQAGTLGATLEVQVYGRMGLAVSARCYHARAHGRVKDNCRFVCEQHPDGMAIETLEGQSFLAINGMQTLSYKCLNLIHELDDLLAIGIGAFRISPHSHDLLPVIKAFRSALEGRVSAPEAYRRITDTAWQIPYCNGFYYARDGHRWVEGIPVKNLG